MSATCCVWREVTGHGELRLQGGLHAGAAAAAALAAGEARLQEPMSSLTQTAPLKAFMCSLQPSVLHTMAASGPEMLQAVMFEWPLCTRRFHLEPCVIRIPCGGPLQQGT